MMQIFKNPPQKQWSELAQRAQLDAQNLETAVQAVFNQVQAKGDEALKELSLKFDKFNLQQISYTVNKQIRINSELEKAILLAMSNIRKFHQAQYIQEAKVETIQGVTCWRENRAIENIGLYIPGGSAPLFSTILMLVVPAQIAGCKNIVVCTPPTKSGKLNPEMEYTLAQLGIDEIFTVGGAQAIAAMCFGTESIPKTDKLFGPGNQYVTAAKQLALKYNVAIDMPAGPSEVLIVADNFANPAFVAADFLSQLEHGADSQALLVCTDENFAKKVMAEIESQMEVLPRKEIVEQSIKNSRVLIFDDLKSCIEFSNNYAPEHLILATENADGFIGLVSNAGSVFIGKWACESAGDYASGTNHTLPTYGFARSYSGLSVDSFVKKISFQKIDESGILAIGRAIELMAEAEQLQAHKNAVSVRLAALTGFQTLSGLKD
jgi:histidinol dehydrogenase